MTAHSAETRERHAADNLVLKRIPEEHQHRVSHFAENVKLPADNVALLFVEHGSKDLNSPLPALGLLALHVPAGANLEMHEAHPEQRIGTVNHKIGRYNGALLDSDSAQAHIVQQHAQDFKTPLDAAHALVSMHPELTHFDPDTAAHIRDRHVAHSPQIEDLAYELQQQGPPADVDSGWATIEVCRDEEGKILPDKNGKPVYRYTLSERTVRPWDSRCGER